MRDMYVNAVGDFHVGEDRIFIPKIEGYKGKRQEPGADPIHTPLTQVACIMVFMKLAINHVHSIAQGESAIRAHTYSHKAFGKLHALFEELEARDLSQKIEYAQSLSKTWHEIIETFIPAILRKIPESERKQIKSLMAKIREYPKDEDHSLGFYLTHYAGEDWLPFPFMKMIRALHEEHAEKGSASHLSIWMELCKTLTPSG